MKSARARSLIVASLMALLAPLAACSGSAPEPAPAAPSAEGPTEPKAAQPAAAQAVAPEAPPPIRGAVPPGVKPHFVPCDPARPELPCTPEPVLAPPSEPKTLQGREVTGILGTRSPEQLRGCRTDADCALTCRVDGDCCPRLCTCDHALNRETLAELQAHQAACTYRGCAKAKCRDPGHDLVPTCVDGLCGAREVPYAEQAEP